MEKTLIQPNARRVFALVVMALIATVMAGLWIGRASAAVDLNYYVSTSGNDKNNGRTNTPWRTIQKATSTAPAGATIYVKSGTYDPFTVTKTGQTINSSTPGGAMVRGKAGVQDVIRVAASGATLNGLTVYGCVPNAAPAIGFEDNGSSGVRIHDGAHAVTVKNMVIRDSKSTNQYGLPFGCYGILVHKANGSNISSNNIYGNGTGIFVNGGGQGAQIANNNIHDNTVIIRNTPGNNDDFGASAINFSYVSALPGPVVSNNTLVNNAGPSSDYGADGGGVEIYASSNLTISGNTITNNENILETGNFAGGTCVNNRFTGNIATGRTVGSKLTWSKGMILRCAQNMIVDSNTFNEIDWWVYVISDDDVFAGGVTGLRITNNTLTQWQKVYHLGVDPVANAMVIDANKFRFTGPIFSSYADDTTSPSLAEWQARTGLDQTSTTF